MATMSNRAAEPLTATVNPSNQEMNSNFSTPKLSSDYEKCREERIKQNLERMQKLGIYDLSLKLRSIKPNTYRKNNKPLSSTNQNKTPNTCIPLLPSSVPTRRSSRLQNTPAVSYTETVISKKGKDENDHLILENSRPEVYTEEHEKLLGDAKMEWTLFVDGYGKDGKKIYDQVRGKTCHQCRQKTLGHRTHCIKCNLVQGQFCGDCLYMRYGENVLEAMQNPDWICPVCRGICNCSLCRQAKGWAPTGILYRKIYNLGYKSVAHYLIQTRRSDPDLEKTKTEPPVCAKRSLPFSNKEVESENGLKTSEKIEPFHDIVKQESGQEPENKNLEAEFESGMMKDEKLSELQSSDEPSCNNLKLESGQESEDKNSEADVDVGENENPKKVNDESEVDMEVVNLENRNEKAENEVENSFVTPETRPKSQKKRRKVVEPVLENSMAGRLRSRRKLK